MLASSLRVRSRAAIGSHTFARFQSTFNDATVSNALDGTTDVKKHTSRRVVKATNAPVVGKETIRSFREFSSISSTSNENENDPTDAETEISMKELYHLASQPFTPLSLSDMYKYASKNVNSKNYAPQRLRNAQFLHKELPIRVAQRAVDLLTLPHGLNKTPQVQKIANAYVRYLKKLIESPCPQTDEQEHEFTDMLMEIVKDRKMIPMAIAKGVSSLHDKRAGREEEHMDYDRLQEMEKALYRFFNARTGLRLLAEHHILSCLKRQQDNVEFRKKQSSVAIEDGTNASFIGCIKDDCDPYIEVKRVADQVMAQCRESHGMVPEIQILDCTPERYASSTFTYVPHHLQYTLAELLNNSCRATIRKHMEGVDDISSYQNEELRESLPPVRVVIAKGAEDVTIKIADKGGGVPRSVLDQMWTFAHSGAKSGENEDNARIETDSVSCFNIRGFGLPMARIYARYFGGELTLKSMEGYGVDAYLYLPVLGHSCENLPKRVRKSPANHDSVHDANHHAYDGDVFSSSFLSGEEPWSGGARHYSTASHTFEKFDRIAI